MGGRESNLGGAKGTRRAGKWGHSSIPSKRGRSWAGGRGFRGFTRSAPSKSRALRKLPDGNFRRPLVGSLRALTSAEMAAPICIAAARTGFLLAALHSVAERVNPRKARPPAPHGPRVLASAARPHLPRLGEESRASGAQPEPERLSLGIFSTPADLPRWLEEGERNCGPWRRR